MDGLLALGARIVELLLVRRERGAELANLEVEIADEPLGGLGGVRCSELVLPHRRPFLDRGRDIAISLREILRRLGESAATFPVEDLLVRLFVFLSRCARERRRLILCVARRA